MRVTLVNNNDVEIYAPQLLPSYSGGSAAFSPPATPTDVFVLGGVANMILRVWRLYLCTVQTTAGVNSWFLIKRSAANTGGTPVAATKVPHDSSDPASSAVCQAYTANPTINGTVGNIWAGKINSPAPATAGIGGLVGVQFDFRAMFGKPIMLRGANEQLAVNFGGAALPPGLSVHVSADWTEENPEDVAGA